MATPIKRRVSVCLVVCLLLSLSGFKCGGSTDKARTLAKAADDAAQAQISIANLIKTAKETGQVSEQFVDQSKRILLRINVLNDQVIKLAKQWAVTPIPEEEQGKLLTLLGDLSKLVTELNNLGLLGIKDGTTQAAFNGFIIALQGAITSTVIVFQMKG